MSEKKPPQRGLGRGLSALMADVQISDDQQRAAQPPRPDTSLPIEKIEPNPDQPRRTFSEEDLQSLAASIEEKGIIQPLIVRKNPNKSDVYQIVAGERRWRAAQIAQLHDIPVLIRELNDTEVLEVAIIENIQRADLNPIEEAAGYRQLMERFGHTQERLAKALSKSRSHIANQMRLLQLPNEVQEYLRSGKLSAGHARALITAEDPSRIAREVVTRGLSVRETERMSKKPAHDKGERKTGAKAEKDPDTRALEGDLSAALGMKVRIEHKPGDDGGQLIIRYPDLEKLDTLCQILSSVPEDSVY